MKRIYALSLISIFAFSLFFIQGINGENVKYGDQNGQILCPVLKGEINKNIYTDYKGKRIYFCCPGCIDEFKKDPEKYMKLLKDVKLDNAPVQENKK